MKVHSATGVALLVCIVLYVGLFKNTSGAGEVAIKHVVKIEGASETSAQAKESFTQNDSRIPIPNDSESDRENSESDSDDDDNDVVQTSGGAPSDAADTTAPEASERPLANDEASRGAFGVFCDETRKRLKKLPEHRGKTHAQISALLGPMWSALDAAKRRRYRRLAKTRAETPLWGQDFRGNLLTDDGVACRIVPENALVDEYPAASPRLFAPCTTRSFSSLSAGGILRVSCAAKKHARYSVWGPTRMPPRGCFSTTASTTDDRKIMCASSEYTGPVRVPRNASVVVVQCGREFNFRMQAALTGAEERRYSERAAETFSSRPPHVSLIILDTVSSHTLARRAPNITRALRELETRADVLVFQFMRGTTVGLSTAANVPQLCAGCPPHHSMDVFNNPTCANQTYNNRFFASLGYTTWTYGDRDYCAASGSIRAVHTEQLTGAGIVPHVSQDLARHCLGERRFHEHTLEQWSAIFDRYASTVPIYFESHQFGNHEETLSGLVEMQQRITEFLLSDHQRHSVTLLVGDHGLGYGSYWQRSQYGYAEHNNPAMVMVVPRQLLTPEEVRVGRINERRLVSHWDLHATMKRWPVRSMRSPLNMTRGGKGDLLPQRGIDLFTREASKRRDCEALGIPMQFCACGTWRPKTLEYPEQQLKERAVHYLTGIQVDDPQCWRFDALRWTISIQHEQPKDQHVYLRLVLKARLRTVSGGIGAVRFAMVVQVQLADLAQVEFLSVSRVDVFKVEPCMQQEFCTCKSRFSGPL